MEVERSHPKLDKSINTIIFSIYFKICKYYEENSCNFDQIISKIINEGPL